MAARFAPPVNFIVHLASLREPRLKEFPVSGRDQ